MSGSRQSRLRDKVSMHGRPRLPDAQRCAIREAATSAAISGSSLDFSVEVKVALLERFEEMCRRQAIKVPDQIRSSVLETMLTELSLNRQIVKGKVHRLVPVTAYCGAIGQTLAAEFPDFANTSHVLHQAMVGHPTDPQGFLRIVRETITSLAADEEFAQFRDKPFVYIHAAVYHSSDPHEFLCKVQKTIVSLTNKMEFINVRSERSILLRLAISYKDPLDFLRRLQETSLALSKDDQFFELHHRPSVFLYAAFSYSNDPRKFLLDVQNTVASLATDSEFSHLRDKRRLLEEAAIHHPTDPRAWLRTEYGSNRHVSRIKQQRRTGPGSDEPSR